MSGTHGGIRTRDLDLERVAASAARLRGRPLFRVERAAGLEPAPRAWKARVLPLNTMRASCWWTGGESNPDYETASLASSRWTTSPLVDLAGLEPAISCVRGRRSPIEPQAHPYARLVSPPGNTVCLVAAVGLEPTVS